MTLYPNRDIVTNGKCENNTPLTSGYNCAHAQLLFVIYAIFVHQLNNIRLSNLGFVTIIGIFVYFPVRRRFISWFPFLVMNIFILPIIAALNGVSYAKNIIDAGFMDNHIIGTGCTFYSDALSKFWHDQFFLEIIKFKGKIF